MTQQRTQAPSETRYALYYPYIHIRDENWLKGTILAFQQVQRLVPNRFTIKDQAITRTYAALEGPAGPLLKSLVVEASEVGSTQAWLRDKLLERINDLEVRYAESTLPPELRAGPQAFEMHTGKFLDHGLLALLMKHHLAWHSREAGEPDSFDWVTLHPKLGAAMMSILALAVARVKGLSVVTPSQFVHQQLLAEQEEAVLQKLLDVPFSSGTESAANATTEELSHVVLTTGFDLTRLTAEQICELLKEGKDLRSFRIKVAGFAANIPSGLDHEEHQKRLGQEAEAVLEEWNGYTKGLPSFAKEALVDAALEKISEKAIELGAGITVAAALGALPGLAISLVVSTGVKMFRKPETPFRFLTRVNKVVDCSIGSIYVPQWRSLAAQMP